MTMKIEIVTAEYEHIPVIADNIRDADRQEMYDYCLLNPTEALERSWSGAKMAWTGLIDDVPVCMFGVSAGTLLTGIGLPWLITAKGIEQHSVVFLRRCKPVVMTMARSFDRLENYVSAQNILAITWLKWLGFKFGQEEEMGLFKKPFIRFWM